MFWMDRLRRESGCRVSIARRKAAATSGVANESPIAQLTTLRLNRSSTTAT